MAVEASNPATLALPPNTLWNTRILALLKAQTLKPPVLNNRYSLFGMSHLAFLPGKQMTSVPHLCHHAAGYVQCNSTYVSQITVDSVLDLTGLIEGADVTHVSQIPVDSVLDLTGLIEGCRLHPCVPNNG